MKFQYVTISVSDLQRSRAFYSETLGFRESIQYEQWIGYGLENDAGFGIIEDPNLGNRSSLDIINFIVNDLESLWCKVRNKATIDTPPQIMPWGTKKFVVLDPDGMKIAFIEDKRGAEELADDMHSKE